MGSVACEGSERRPGAVRGGRGALPPAPHALLTPMAVPPVHTHKLVALEAGIRQGVGDDHHRWAGQAQGRIAE